MGVAQMSTPSLMNVVFLAEEAQRQVMNELIHPGVGKAQSGVLHARGHGRAGDFVHHGGGGGVIRHVLHVVHGAAQEADAHGRGVGVVPVVADHGVEGGHGNDAGQHLGGVLSFRFNNDVAVIVRRYVGLDETSGQQVGGIPVFALGRGESVGDGVGFTGLSVGNVQLGTVRHGNGAGAGNHGAGAGSLAVHDQQRIISEGHSRGRIACITHNKLFAVGDGHAFTERQHGFVFLHGDAASIRHVNGKSTLFNNDVTSKKSTVCPQRRCSCSLGISTGKAGHRPSATERLPLLTMEPLPLMAFAALMEALPERETVAPS